MRKRYDLANAEVHTLPGPVGAIFHQGWIHVEAEELSVVIVRFKHVLSPGAELQLVGGGLPGLRPPLSGT